MRIAEYEHQLDLSANTAGYERTPGLHMSEIYNSLYAKLDPKRYSDKDGGPDVVKMELGTTYEEVLEPALAARHAADRPGEFACTPDGRLVNLGTPNSIIFSPDQLIFNGVMRVGEFKCTWMSIRYGITDKRFDKWFTQIKAYCFPLKTCHARLYVLFVNGDYSYKPPHGGPHMRAWDIEFTARELKDNWDMLMRHARREKLIR